MIYLFKSVEKSEALFKVKADSVKNGINAVEKFINDDETHDDYRDFMNSTCSDNIVLVAQYENEDEFNRHINEYDFYTEAEKIEEDKYDLYFSIEDNPNHKICKVWEGISLFDVSQHILDYKDYHIKPSVPSMEVFKRSINNGNRLLYYKLFRRDTING